MGWEQRGGKRYYYRARRANGRVVKEYCGTGAAAEEVARLDAEAAEKRRRRQQEWREYLAREAQIVALLDEIHVACDAVVVPAMTAAGYHRVRGEWRKKRKPRAEPTAGAPALSHIRPG